MATIIEQPPTTAPTERSNSPPIISMPTGRAMMPRSEAVSSQFAVPSGVRKPFRPAVIAKKAKTSSAETTPPASGRSRKLISRPRRGRRSTEAKSSNVSASDAIAAFVSSGCASISVASAKERGVPNAGSPRVSLFRADHVRIGVEHFENLVDVLLVDDARAGRHRADRREAVFGVERRENNAEIAVEIRLLVDEKIELAVLDLLQGDARNLHRADMDLAGHLRGVERGRGGGADRGVFGENAVDVVMGLEIGANVAADLALIGRVRRRQFEVARCRAELLRLLGQAFADRLQVRIARHVDDAEDVLRARLGQALRRDLADFGALLADKAEGAVRLPLVLAGLIDIDRDAGCDRLLDIGIDDAGDEVADDDRVRLLGDRGLHRAGRRRLDIGFVDRNVVELDAERLGGVLRALVERREERIVERAGNEGDQDLLILRLRRPSRRGGASRACRSEAQ